MSVYLQNTCVDAFLYFRLSSFTSFCPFAFVCTLHICHVPAFCSSSVCIFAVYMCGGIFFLLSLQVLLSFVASFTSVVITQPDVHTPQLHADTLHTSSINDCDAIKYLYIVYVLHLYYIYIYIILYIYIHTYICLLFP